MAIVWDSTPAYAVRDGVRHEFRVGVEFTQSPTTVTASTTSVTVTARRYLQTRYAVYDNANSVSWSGGFGSGSTSFGFSTTDTSGWSSSNIRAIGAPLTRTFAPSFTSTTTTSISLSMSGIDAIPGTSSVSASITTAKRPISAPAAVTGASVARSSDTRHTLKWTLPASDPAKPVTNVLIRRRDVGTASWTTIATLGTVSSYTDSSTTAGHRYEWQVLTKNSAGTSATVYAGSLYTAPAAPTGVTAVRMGSDVMVSWTKSASPHTRSELAWRQEGGAWQYPGWTSTGTSYLIKSPDPSQPLQYAVRAQADNGGPLLSSAYTWSNLVQLLTPPAAPTQLAPTVAEAGQPIPLSWQHNTVDTSAQTAYELRWRPRGSQDPWGGVPKTAATVSEHTLLAGLWPSDVETEWQVRTWGQHADPSEWSQLALTAVSERPSVTLTEPTTQAWPSSSVVVRWDFFDPEGSAQGGYIVRLYSGTGEVLWERAATSTYRAVAVDYRLQDGMSYEVGVQARDALGLYSDEVRQRLDVSYAQPPTAVVEADWDQDAGAMVVSISHLEPTRAEVDAVDCQLWRSTAGGDWVLLEDGLDLETTVVDRIPAIGAVTYYRVDTVSALPSTARSTPVEVVVPGRGWIFLNGGPGWARMVRLRDNARLKRSFSAEKELFQVAGRDYPISIQHEGRSKSIDVSVSTDPRSGGASYAELEAFLDEVPDPICYRDATGARFFCSISGVSGGRSGRWAEDASFTVTRIDHTE